MCGSVKSASVISVRLNGAKPTNISWIGFKKKKKKKNQTAPKSNAKLRADPFWTLFFSFYL